MKKELIQFMICSLLLSICSVPQLIAQKGDLEEDTEETKDINPRLIAEIDQLTVRYNKYRSKTSQIYKDHGFESKQMVDNENLTAQADEENRLAAKAIFKKYGFPTFSLVGKDKAHEYWVIVLNCDRDVDFQLDVLKVMDKLIHEDEADKGDYAYLSDRARINLGMKQVYGTQVRFNENKNTYEPYELNKPAEVDKRRAELNLGTMSDYIRTMNKKYEGTLKRKNKSSRYYLRKP